MALRAGTRIGPYEVVGSLGAGGMGEVYRARDSRLQRDIAIKILPTEFSQDAERLSRFEREARTLASLNHQNIAQVYGFEQTPDLSALAMEFVEGETLAVRIRRSGGALATSEAIGIARQIVAALDAAHERGVVHRDLNPANVMLTPAGDVKVLDFGLAKSAGRDADPSLSPTAHLLTETGAIVGTAAYMSPEQARGRATDKRGDIWAFGCVLYEMLTGHLAFPGDNVSDILVGVLQNDPDWNKLPQGTSRGVRALLRAALQKDPRQRLHRRCAHAYG
jgi:serine/threonine protein kinase